MPPKIARKLNASVKMRPKTAGILPACMTRTTRVTTT